MASSSNSPCAACKFLRRKCTPECVFAPYFPPDSPQKFANVHKVFGASNVSKLLNELPPSRREDAVNSLAYEADARLSDPVYGCVGVISLLQHQLKQLQADLLAARAELSRYMAAAGIPGPLPPSFLQAAAVAAHHQQQYQHHHHSSAAVGIGMGLPGPASREQLYREQQQQQQQLLESQQMAVAVAMAAREQQELMRNYEHGGDIGRFGGGGYDQGVGAAVGSGAGSGSVGGGLGFNAFALSPAASPSSSGFISPIQAHHNHQQQQQQRSVGGEDRKPCSSGSVGGGRGCGGSGGAGSTGLSS